MSLKVLKLVKYLEYCPALPYGKKKKKKKNARVKILGINSWPYLNGWLNLGTTCIQVSREST